MNKAIYLQTFAGTWELVDNHVFKNRTRALNGVDDRYNGNSVLLGEHGELEINVKDLTSKDLAIISHFLGVKASEAGPGPYVAVPAVVLFAPSKKNGRPTLYELESGQEWIAKAA